MPDDYDYMPDPYHTTRIVAGHASDAPLILTEEEQAFATKVARNVDDGSSAVAKLDAAMADIRAKEAGLVLTWLNENGCLVFGKLPKALKAIEAGAHRR